MARPYQFRGEHGDLLLDEALGERYARHYIRILESSPGEFAAMQLTAAVRAPAPDEPAAYSWREPRGPLLDGYELIREGRGPETCSSSQALALLPEICWDVCGYYRRLGFCPAEFRQVTPERLRLRYLELDPRQEDEPLFYALSQLLDPLIRRAYDLMPLGGLFLGDRGVRELIERRAAMEASRRNAGADPGEATAQSEVLREWGFEKGLTADEARERLQPGPGQQAPPGSEESALGGTMSGWDRRWSYFRLADPCDDDLPALAGAPALEAWQVMLCAIFSGHGIAGKFSVGIWPGAGPKVWRDSKGSCIFFIGKEQPTQDMANEAIRGYLAQDGKQGERFTHASYDDRCGGGGEDR